MISKIGFQNYTQEIKRQKLSTNPRNRKKSTLGKRMVRMRASTNQPPLGWVFEHLRQTLLELVEGIELKPNTYALVLGLPRIAFLYPPPQTNLGLLRNLGHWGNEILAEESIEAMLQYINRTKVRKLRTTGRFIPSPPSPLRRLSIEELQARTVQGPIGSALDLWISKTLLGLKGRPEETIFEGRTFPESLKEAEEFYSDLGWKDKHLGEVISSYQDLLHGLYSNLALELLKLHALEVFYIREHTTDEHPGGSYDPELSPLVAGMDFPFGWVRVKENTPLSLKIRSFVNTLNLLRILQRSTQAMMVLGTLSALDSYFLQNLRIRLAQLHRLTPKMIEHFSKL